MQEDVNPLMLLENLYEILSLNLYNTLLLNVNYYEENIGVVGECNL